METQTNHTIAEQSRGGVWADGAETAGVHFKSVPPGAVAARHPRARSPSASDQASAGGLSNRHAQEDDRSAKLPRGVAAASGPLAPPPLFCGWHLHKQHGSSSKVLPRSPAQPQGQAECGAADRACRTRGWAGTDRPRGRQREQSSELDVDLGQDALAVRRAAQRGQVRADRLHERQVQRARRHAQRALQHVVGVRVLCRPRARG